MGSFYSSTHSAQTSHVWLISLELIKVIPGSQINFHLQSGIEFPNFHFGPLTRRDGCPIIWMNWINHLDDTDIVIMIKFQLKFSSIWSERDHKYLIILTTKVINCLLMSGMRAKTNNQGIHSNNWCPGESHSPECRPHLTWLITIIICPEGEQIRLISWLYCRNSSCWFWFGPEKVSLIDEEEMRVLHWHCHWKDSSWTVVDACQLIRWNYVQILYIGFEFICDVELIESINSLKVLLMKCP